MANPTTDGDEVRAVQLLMGRETVVYSTPWFELVAKDQAEGQPHYSIRTRDYVLVVCRTADQRLVLVRQFRPAVGHHTLELPAGHVESGESPEAAARKELLEETGFRAEQWDLLGRLAPDTGRLSNAMWCYFADRATMAPGASPEAGIQTQLHGGSIGQLIGEPEFTSALNLAAVFLAVQQGRLPLA